MAEPIHRGGTWWYEQPDGTWTRWNPEAAMWEPQVGGPPGETAEDSKAGERPYDLVAKSVHDARSYRPLDENARWLAYLFIAYIVAELVLVFLTFQVLDSASGEPASAPITEDHEAANDGRVGALTFVGFFVGLPLGILFIVWFKKAYDNLPVLGASGLRYASWWAIGCWFIPIWNLFRPKQIMNDIYRASDPTAAPQQGETWKGRPVDPIINWWWGTWIANLVITLDFREINDVGDLRLSAWRSIVGTVPLVIAAILAIKIVRMITEREAARAASTNAHSHPSASPS